MSKYKVSIIIPVYNKERELEKCIESCVNQTLDNIEIIMIDDASTDASAQLMRVYENKYPEKIKCMYLEENIKQGGARNRGIKIAQGEFITFVDADDWIDLQMCEALYNKAIETDSDIVYCNILRESNDGTYRIGNNFPDDLVGKVNSKQIQKLIFKLSVGPVAHIIKKEIILHNNLFFPEQMIFEDSAVTRMWNIHAKKIEKVHKAYYTYCLNLESTGNKKQKQYKNDAFQSMELLYKHLETCLLTKEFVEERNVICLYMAISNLPILLRIYGEESLPQIRKDFKKFVNSILEKDTNRVNWKYWFTPWQQKLLTTEWEEYNRLSADETLQDYKEYYKNIYTEVKDTLNALKERGIRNFVVWAKTPQTQAFIEVFGSFVVIDSKDEIECRKPELVISLKSAYCENIRYSLKSKEILIFDLQGYFLRRGKIQDYVEVACLFN